MGFAIKSRHVLMGAAGFGLCLTVSDRRAAAKTMSNQVEPARRSAKAQAPQIRHAAESRRTKSRSTKDNSWVRTAQFDLKRIQAVERALAYNVANTPLARAPEDKMTFEQLSKLADDAEMFLRQRQARWGRLEHALKVHGEPHAGDAHSEPRTLGQAYRSAVAMDDHSPLASRTRGHIDTYLL